MSRLRKSARVFAVLLVAFPAAAAAPNPEPLLEQRLPVVRYLPQDPLMVWAGNVGRASEIHDSLLAMVRRFLDEEELAEFELGLQKVDAELGFSLRDDLLAHLGPQLAFVADLPPIDLAAGAIMAGTPDGIGQALGGIRLWMEVDDEAAVKAAIGKLAVLSKAESEVGDGFVRLWWPQPEGTESGPDTPPPPSLYFATGNGILVLGFQPEPAKAMLEPAPAEARLITGADFGVVFAHLDREADTLTYVNLPRLQQRVRESSLVMGMAAGNEEAEPVLEFLLDPELANTGIGATTRLVGGGVRQVAFGPTWMSGGASMMGIVAAVAVPNLLNAIDRGRQKRTMAVMRGLAAEMEMYAVEAGAYPTTEGWVDCGELAAMMAGVDPSQLPTTDGWQNSLHCISDGTAYRIVSGGKDGNVSRDYSGDIEFGETQNFAEDIVFVDGAFVVYPAGQQVN